MIKIQDLLQILAYNGQYGNQPNFNLQQDIQNQPQAILQINKLVYPVTYAPIKFQDQSSIISYTDCFQISLLRFLHLALSDGYKIIEQKLTKYMDGSQECMQLMQFFKKYNKVYGLSKYYQGEDGLKLRSDWCVFLNKRSFLKYKKEQKYEVCASLDNLFSFFNVFFPKLNLSEFESEQEKLDQLFQLLSFQKKLRCKLYTKIIINNQYFVQNYIKIYINQNNLIDWQIYQYFDKNNQVTRITGHSDYRISPYLPKIIKQSQIPISELPNYQLHQVFN